MRPRANMEPVVKKVYYSIGEVSVLAGLKPHVLRYWESQFGAIAPGKNRGGSRVYRVEDIETILLVKQLLYEERFTIEGAKQKLNEMRQDGEIGEAGRLRAEPAILASIKQGLLAAQAALTLPAAPADPATPSSGSAAPAGPVAAPSSPAAAADPAASPSGSAAPSAPAAPSSGPAAPSDPAVPPSGPAAAPAD